MSSDEKQFPASDFKIDNLRQQGVFPFSNSLQLFGLVIALPLAIWCTVELGLEKFVRLVQASKFPSADLQNILDPRSHATEVIQLCLGTTVLLLLIIGVSLFLIGALQTKFFFSLGQFQFDLSRLFTPGFLQGWSKRLLLACPMVVLSLMIFYFQFSAIYYFVPHLPEALYPGYVSSEELAANHLGLSWFSTEGDLSTLAELGNQVQELFQAVLQSPVGIFNRYWIYAVFVTLFIGVISRLGSVMIFRYENRMTRAEVEAEIKENEPNAQFRKMR